MSNRRRAIRRTLINGASHEEFVLGKDAYGRVRLLSRLPKVISVSGELWQAMANGVPFATITADQGAGLGPDGHGNDLTVRTVETTFTYRRTNGESDGSRSLWYAELRASAPTTCICPAGDHAVPVWHTPDCPLSPASFT